MKNILKISGCILTTMIAAHAYANLTASTQSLPGEGALNPKESIKISLNPLLHGASYNVQCTIDNENADTVDMHFDVALGSAGGLFGKFYINSKELNTVHQAKLATGKSTYELHDVISNGKSNNLFFQNLDMDNKISVTDCQATPVTSS